ncbi:MAG: succinylglutamate desuccinylase/aspartoacylase family protein [Planctomycetota bacterium]
MSAADGEPSPEPRLGGDFPVERRRRPRRFQREIGYLGDGHGPLLVVTGGIHGNEPGGVFALERVVANLQERGLVPRGTLLALGGNLPALEQGERYLEQDLNRMWTLELLEQAQAADAPSHEQRQLLEIHARISAAIEASTGPVAFLDLHSASAEGSPFALMGDTLANRELAFAMGLPVILGLEENVDGTLLSWFGEMGHVAVGVEGGQHLDENTTRHQEACVWTALAAVGLLSPEELSWLPEQQRLLRRAGAGLPQVVAVSHRHGIEPSDRFRMVPGYVNFDRVERGEVLAHDVSGPIPADFTGNILLPLYQGRGADGFFLGKPVRKVWLRLSAVLRKTGIDRLLHWLPGVDRDSERADALWVDRRIARLRALDLFHLFGFWRLDEDGPKLRVARRRERPN